jgi:hypothetical protein
VNGPTWLADAFAAIMIATAMCCGGLLVATRVRYGRFAGDAVLHLAMGVAMTWMLLGTLERRWVVPFAAAFAGAAGWLIGQLLRHRAPTSAPATQHRLQHLVACAAMIYMFLGLSLRSSGASRSSGTTAMIDMAGRSALGASYSLLALLLAIVLLGYLAWNVGELAALGGTRSSLVSAPGVGVGSGEGPRFAPRLMLGCQIAMGMAMAYMLLAMA